MKNKIISMIFYLFRVFPINDRKIVIANFGGKGYGSEGGHSVLKEKVRRWLKQCDCVMAFAEAQEIDGGSGALIVLLKGLAHAPYSAPRP